MRFITNIRDHKPTDLRVEPAGMNSWKVYEPGDVLPPTVPGPTQAEIDAAEIKEQADVVAARAYAKLNILKVMTPAQVQTWAGANVTNFAQAQDVLLTLTIAVSVLSRRL